MIQINCPWCGERNEEEFVYGGPSHIERPSNPDASSEVEWSAYLFNRVNSQGIHLERWQHRFGCRQWFNLARDTVTHNILNIYNIGDSKPEISDKFSELKREEIGV